MDFVDIEYDKISGSSMNVFATKYPTIPATVEKMELIEIPGRSGSLHVSKKCFEETEIQIEFNYIGKAEMWNERWRDIRKWLSVRNAKMIFGDDMDFFFEISRVILGSNERTSRRIGKFTATFVTKDGLAYLKEGDFDVDYKNITYNPGIFSQPIYKITGEGLCTLTVNGKSMTANVSDNITIDTELMIAYREDGTLINTAVSGNYEDLYLQEGNNTITVTDGFECKVIPRWRCL